MNKRLELALWYLLSEVHIEHSITATIVPGMVAFDAADNIIRAEALRHAFHTWMKRLYEFGGGFKLAAAFEPERDELNTFVGYMECPTDEVRTFNFMLYHGEKNNSLTLGLHRGRSGIYITYLKVNEEVLFENTTV